MQRVSRIYYREFKSCPAHFGRSKECKKLYNEQTDDSGRFYSTVEVRVGPQDHQAGGQSMRPGLVQRISHQSAYISDQMRADLPAAVDEMELEGIPYCEKYLKSYFLSRRHHDIMILVMMTS